MTESVLMKQNHLLQQDNESLEKKIKSLENENRMMQNILSVNNIPYPSQNEEYVDNIWKDEMRDGFLVSSHRKRLWNNQIEILREFDRICKKHNLKWFANDGTLLGAARHKGFIPWDFDIDVAMLRPDYEKFRQVVAEELKPPYFFEPWYNHRLETDMALNIKDDENLPVIPLILQMSYQAWWPFYPILRIMDSRTTMILRSDRKAMPQNNFIDIMPLDPAPPFENEYLEKIFESVKFLYLGTITPWRVGDFLDAEKPPVFPPEMIKNFLRLPFRKRALVLEKFLAENFFDSENITNLQFYVFNQEKDSSKYLFPSKYFKETVYLPFEKFQVPAPTGYENVLTSIYGEWRKFSVRSSRLLTCSMDIPYEEYSKTSLLMNELFRKR